jgi:hypothetical protein
MRIVPYPAWGRGAPGPYVGISHANLEERELEHWRGTRGVLACNAAPVLEFALPLNPAAT